MKGSPRNLPTNHVEWDNEFKSNMPDWKTARESAAASDMLFALKEARTALLAVDVREVDANGTNWNHFIEYGRFEKILECVQKTIDKAEGTDAIVKAFENKGLPQTAWTSEIINVAMENPIIQDAIDTMKKPFPKPPGVK